MVARASHAEMIVTSILQRSTNPQRRIADEDIPHLLSMLHCVAICAPLWDAPWPADKPSEHPRAIYDLLDTKHPSLWVEHPMVDRLALMLTPQEAAELWEKAAAHNGADLAIAAVLFLRRYQHPNVLLHGLRTHGVPVLCTPRLSAHAALAIVADLPSAQDIEQRTKADPSGVAHSVLYAEIGTILDTHTDFRAKLAAQAMAHRLWIEKEHKARMLEVQKAMIQKKHEDEARMKAAAAQRHINRIARD